MAALLVGRDAPNFLVVEGTLALVATVLALAAAAVLPPAVAWMLKRTALPRSRSWVP